MAEWMTASTKRRRYRSKAIRAGLAPAEKSGADGIVHAYEDGGAETACGGTLTGLVLWPSVPFRDGVQRCQTCAERVAADLSDT